MSIRPVLVLACCVALYGAPLRAQRPGAVTAGDSSRITIVQEYLSAFNAPDDSSMRSFLLRHVPQDNVNHVSIEERLERFRSMKKDLVSLTLHQAVATAPNRVKAVMQNAKGEWLLFTFMLAEKPPHGVIGIGVTEANGPEQLGSTPSPARTEDELVSVAKSIVDSLCVADRFSGVVLIAKGGNPIFQTACGLADREQRIPATVETKFNIGSINKAFTSIAMHRLVKEGRLALDDTLGKFLPMYPNAEAREKVTVRHLLAMSSGVGDFFGERYEKTPKEKLRTISDFIPLFGDIPLAFVPGTQRQYSNGGYILLGAIIEKVSGEDYYRYVRRNIFEPTGMNETESYEKDAVVPGRAIGYTRRGGDVDAQVRRNNYSTLPGRGSSAGGGYSTAGDLLKFVSAVKDGTLWSPELSSPGGFRIAGGAPGLNAAIEWDPEHGYAVIVLSNYDPPSAVRVAEMIRDRLPQ